MLKGKKKWMIWKFELLCSELNKYIIFYKYKN